MPLYEYRCDACNHEFEALQKISSEDAATYRHPVSYMTAIHSSHKLSAPSSNGETTEERSIWKREGRKDAFR